jgi:L-amino acid N-acyltransferase YncA
MQIRSATLADAPAIAHVHAASWRTTYAGIIPNAVLAQMTDEARRLANWQRILGDPQSPESVFVAEDDAGAIIGFAGGGPTRSGPEDAARYPGELYAIYLLQYAQGHGLGRALVRAVAQRLAEQGKHAMIVWVLAANPARHFYAALGGQFVREQPFTMGGTEIIEAAFGWDDTTFLYVDGHATGKDDA